jgi:hypothetical protein
LNLFIYLFICLCLCGDFQCVVTFTCSNVADEDGTEGKRSVKRKLNFVSSNSKIRIPHAHLFRSQYNKV